MLSCSIWFSAPSFFWVGCGLESCCVRCGWCRTRHHPHRKVRPERAADHSPPSSVAVMEQYSYTSTHPLDHTGPVTGSRYLYLYVSNSSCIFAESTLSSLSHFLKLFYIFVTYFISSWRKKCASYVENGAIFKI